MSDEELAELVKLLAEKVMGWTLRDCFPYGPRRAVPGWCSDEKRCKFFVYDWEPNSKIEQAFMVAEKIGGLELVDVGMRWKASVGDLDGYQRADTPALAICLAAQEWVKAK